jgi:peptidoglycan/LPS O-acetylase OafA/YrhL
MFGLIGIKAGGISSSSPAHRRLEATQNTVNTHILKGADFFRFSGCMIVLFGHLAQRIDFVAAQPSLLWLKPLADGASYGVVIFFVLSGFLLSQPFWRALLAHEPMPDLSVYFLRRLARVAPAYWIVCLICSVLAVAVLGFVVDDMFIIRTLSALTFLSSWHEHTLVPIEINSPLWSVPFEVMAYCFLPLGMCVVFNLSKRFRSVYMYLTAWLAVGSVCFLMHCWFVQWVGLGPVPTFKTFTKTALGELWFPQYNVFAFCTMLSFGVMAGGIQYLNILQLAKGYFDVLFLGMLAVLFGLIWFSPTPTTDGIMLMPYKQFPIMPAVIATMLVVGTKTRWIMRVLENAVVVKLSKISFGIYLYHYLVMEMIKFLFAPGYHYAGVTEPQAWGVLALLVIALSLVLGQLSWSLIEYPAMLWAKKREQVRAVKPNLVREGNR